MKNAILIVGVFMFTLVTISIVKNKQREDMKSDHWVQVAPNGKVMHVTNSVETRRTGSTVIVTGSGFQTKFSDFSEWSR